ncbi:PAS domain S-box protein [Spirosoma sordidisoli]|uniref:histidine kinase n=1 Tax=Spirosoma sordidisoli TaxID=2502893 RepID=A0A4Q2UK38_9BACT|nr:PAS domain S-box protein [Spirosoma sordidisoli]RYC69002.1 PAS domain S-box protein [Spirosoma sordidisoli]
MESERIPDRPVASSSDAQLMLENERLRRELQRLEALVQQQHDTIVQNEQRWTFMLDGMADGVWELNLQTQTITRSARYRQMLGYSLDEFPDTVQIWMDLLHPQDRAAMADPGLRPYEEGLRQSHETTYRLLAKDGSYRHIVDRGQVVSYSADGKPLMMVGISTDVTEQKRLEEDLRRNLNRLANLIANFQDGILLEDENRSIVLVNQHFCDMFSVPLAPDQLIGLDCSGMAEQSKHYFAEPEPFVERVNQLLRDQKLVIGEELLLADGRVLERDYVPVFLDNVYTGHLWKYSDITKRKRADDAALRQKEKYQRIIENINLGLIEVDLDDRIVYTNQSFCAMSGYRADELIGEIATDVLLRGQNVSFMKEKSESRLSGKMDAYEVAVTSKGGEAMWWLISGAPLYSETGQVIGSTGIHLDITKQKQLESELRIAKQEAENSARAKELFLANMSHEIRTPMNAILSLGQQLTKTPLNEQQQFFLRMINTAGSNLLVIINDILDFSKIEAGQLSLEKIGFDMAELLRSAVHVMTHNADKKGLGLSLQLDGGIAPVLLGDPYRLNQILLNLIGNAIKFTDRGRVDVHCTYQQHHQMQTISITVADTGIGMDPQFQRNLFTKFTQEDGSIGRRYGGTGLGMSITKQLVDLMGGTIRVRSVKNEGTTVTVQLTLPIGTETDKPAQSQEIGQTGALSSRRILLVEDNEMNRLVVTTILDPYNMVIIEATNGLEAIELLRTESVDLVLMDVQMPVLDGLEATRIIRRDISTSLPIIALTASAIRKEKEACYQAGMNDFLAKPFDEKNLIGKLANWLKADSNLPQNQQETMNEDKYDLSSLQAISRGNDEFVRKMISLFCTETPAAAAQIKAAYESGDFETIKYLAHRTKPSIDNLGIESQRAPIRQIEQLAVTDPASPELKTLIDNFERAVINVTTHMRQTYLTDQEPG